jgi:PAS domain S-box-containing protein
MMAILQDVTEQVLAKKKLPKSEARRELLSNRVPAMIFYLDTEMRYLSYNVTFTHWFGVNGTEAIGKTVRDLIGEKAYEKARLTPILFSARSECLYC